MIQLAKYSLKKLNYKITRRSSMEKKKTSMSRRTKALLWLVVVGSVIGVLVALQEIAILYILATLALIVLLLIVAFADLEKVGTEI